MKPRRHLDCLPPEPQLGRRAALGLLATAAATATLGAACGNTTVVSHGSGGGDDGGSGDDGSAGDDASAGDAAACTPVGKDHGALTSFAEGTWTASSGVIIGHDTKGLFAYTMTCTHEGCLVDKPSSSGVTECPCHGAQFDGNGAVIRGPASRPLQHYAVDVCNGHVYVDTKTTVPASTRTPV